MATVLDMTAPQVADIAEGFASKYPNVKTSRSPRADGSIAMQFYTMTHSWLLVLVAIAFFPIGLLLLLIEKNIPKVFGDLTITPLMFGNHESTLAGNMKDKQFFAGLGEALRGDGWWLASDGNFYPPEALPGLGETNG